MLILFLHGFGSTVGGIKPTYLKDHGHTVLNPGLPDDDFDEAVRIAQAEFDLVPRRTSGEDGCLLPSSCFTCHHQEDDRYR